MPVDEIPHSLEGVGVGEGGEGENQKRGTAAKHEQHGRTVSQAPGQGGGTEEEQTVWAE